jgi:hypothetical protein
MQPANRMYHTIGSTGSCLIGSDTSTIEVSVSVFAPLAREDLGAMLQYLNPERVEEQVNAPYAN